MERYVDFKMNLFNKLNDKIYMDDFNKMIKKSFKIFSFSLIAMWLFSTSIDYILYKIGFNIISCDDIDLLFTSQLTISLISLTIFSFLLGKMNKKYYGLSIFVLMCYPLKNKKRMYNISLIEYVIFNILLIGNASVNSISIKSSFSSILFFTLTLYFIANMFKECFKILLSNSYCEEISISIIKNFILYDNKKIEEYKENIIYTFTKLFSMHFNENSSKEIYDCSLDYIDKFIFLRIFNNFSLIEDRYENELFKEFEIELGELGLNKNKKFHLCNDIIRSSLNNYKISKLKFSTYLFFLIDDYIKNNLIKDIEDVYKYLDIIFIFFENDIEFNKGIDKEIRIFCSKNLFVFNNILFDILESYNFNNIPPIYYEYYKYYKNKIDDKYKCLDFFIIKNINDTYSISKMYYNNNTSPPTNSTK